MRGPVSSDPQLRAETSVGETFCGEDRVWTVTCKIDMVDDVVYQSCRAAFVAPPDQSGKMKQGNLLMTRGSIKRRICRKL